MRWTVRSGVGAFCALALAVGGCAADAAMDFATKGEAPWGQDPADAGSGTKKQCEHASDCPTGYTCDFGLCTPPEQEESASPSLPPVASPHYVYALNPSAHALARIDPATLAIESIPLGAEPVALAALPGEDAVAVLTAGEVSLSVVDSTSLPSKVIRVPLKRPYGRIAVSPDGVYAIAYPDPAKAPAQGAEGVVTLVNLQKVRSGAAFATACLERAVGYRVTDVIYRVEEGKARDAFVLTKDGISVIDLDEPQANPLPRRVDLPESMRQSLLSREVVATADGSHVVVRSTTDAELAYFDGVSLRAVPLPGVATDLDLMPDGSAAIAVLRAARKLALIEIPADLLDPTGIETIDVSEVAVGQAVIPQPMPEGAPFALLYTNASPVESFARVELTTGAITVYPLEKWIEEIVLAPDGLTALVLHRPNPYSEEQDPYERQVDRDQGYTVFDVRTGYSQLRRTGTVAPGPFAFAPSSAWLGVTLSDSTQGEHSVDAVNLRSLVSSPLGLMSKPLFVGPVPAAQGTSAHRIFVSQEHPAGRISVLTLDTGQVRTATGFTLSTEGD